MVFLFAMSDQHQSSHSEYLTLSGADTDPARLKREREKARALKKTQWWRAKLGQGICYYCEKKYASRDLTMDHIVPLARGGISTPGNVVVSCHSCNQNKKLRIPAEELIKQLGKNG